MIRQAFAAWAAYLELRAAELREGVTLIEAVSASAFEQELQMVTRNETERQELRDVAIRIGQLGGLAPDEVEPVMREHAIKGTRAVYELTSLRSRMIRIIDEQIRNNGGTL